MPRRVAGKDPLLLMPPAEGPDQSEVSARDATDRLERKRVLNVLAQRRYREWCSS